MAVDLYGIQTVDHLNRIFQPNNHDFTVSSGLKHALSALTRSGHARFRRAPVSFSDPQAPSVSSQSEDKLPNDLSPAVNKDTTVSVSSSFVGGSVEGSVSNGRQLSSLGIVAPSLSFSSRKPPLPSSHRKRNGTDTPSASLQGSGRDNRSVSRSGCHCCKRRKTGSKREVKKIPIIGSKVESIPADDYSWKKYGEKKVHGSPFPRVYYKCNSVKGCPARKRVELDVRDSKMLVVTYAGEHHHRHAPSPLSDSLNNSQIKKCLL